MLYEDEKMVRPDGRQVGFNNVIFRPVVDTETPNPLVKGYMSKGRLFLTNHRILLLTAEPQQGMYEKGSKASKPIDQMMVDMAAP